MLFINFLCLLYLMVLADSHTLSKSIDNDKKVDDIFESINDVDRPTIPKTRKDRQHNYKVYYTKDDAVLKGIKITKPNFEVETATDKRTVKLTPKLTTENAKRHKSPKRRASSFWKKLRGKNKKKETKKHVSKGRRTNHKKESHKVAYLTTKPLPGKTESKKKHRNKLHLRQTEHKVSKRDVSGLFSTRPYSNTPQGYKLQMGIAPQFDNMLKSKNSKIEPVQLRKVAVATADNPVVSDNLHAQLDRINSNLDTLKEKYGQGRVTSDNKPSATSNQGHITTEFKYQNTPQIDRVLRAMKVEAVSMMSSVTELSNDAAEATIDSIQRTSVSALNTLVSNNEIGNREKRTVAITGTYATNPEDSTINANTESHYLEARSIKEDAITIAMNVEDLIQRELKNLYNKVKEVSNDFRKEVHTTKSKLKEGYEKFSSKLKNKTQPTPKSKFSTTTCPPKHKTCKLTPKVQVHSSTPSRTSTSNIFATTTTTAPRVKKKDNGEEDWVGDSFFTLEALSKQPYDDYVKLTLYEQMLSRTHENNANKLLATPEYAIYTKNKREARRLSKRNPETLTDVKLTEVVRNIFDDGGTMPDYDYIDPTANVSSTGKSWVSSKTTANNYNRDNYVIDDLSGSADYSSQGLKGTSPMPNDNYNAADANNYVTGSVSSATVAYNTVPSGNPASDSKFEGLSNKIFYNQFVDGYKHYLKFQQELRNQNFSNLVKYQAHRHHSVDDIGKYILNKIPPITTFNRRKRNVKFSDDSDDNMDYQEITSKSDDSWFKKHFYMFIDNGPPKKYHTSETVELKPGSVDRKPYLTNTTPITREDFIKIDSKGVLRKTKNAQEISMDDLSNVLASIKVNQGTNNPLKKASPPETQKEDTFMDNYNATDDATNQGNSFIGRFLSGKRRHVTKKRPIMTLYFPTTNYMYADNQHGRFKRSNTKESFQNTLMADFMNKDIIEKKAATTATKRVFADAAQTRNRETNKYGYVDIDLVPQQTAVKLRDTTKKSIIKNFFNQFHFKKKKTKKNKPKRSAYYNYYSPSPRRVRFNPIKKLRNLFKNKERQEEKKDFVAQTTFDVNNEDPSISRDLEAPKLDKPVFNVDEMQKQIPNITDPYSIPLKNVQTTRKSVAHHYKLDDKDQDLLSDYHLESSSTEPLLSPTTTDEPIMITKPVDTKAKQDVTIASLMPTSTITTIPNQKEQPYNVMKVNIKTLRPIKSKTRLKESTTDDLSILLEQKRKDYGKPSESLPTITSRYDHDASFKRKKDKYDYKENVQFRLPVLPEELSIRSNLTRYMKFPIRQGRNKMRRDDGSEADNIERDKLGFDSSSMLQYLRGLVSSSTDPSPKRKTAVNTLKKVHPHTYLNRHKEGKGPYTDYFNDLLMWHNDILNLDSVPNSLWLNILKTLKTNTADYTTPDMKKLMWNEMNDFLGNSAENSVTVPTGATGVKANDHVSGRALDNQLDDDEEGVVRSVAMNDGTILKSKDVLIKGESKYFQYNKPVPYKSPDERPSSNFVMKLNTLNNNDKAKGKVKVKRKDHRREPLTPADIPADTPILVDATLMAYDDDVDLVVKELEVKEPCPAKSSKRSSKKPPVAAKTEHNSVLKTNKAPEQYYTTPLPMKSQDFQMFLKDYQMDVDFVTAPLRDLPTLPYQSSTIKKHNKGSKQNIKNADPATTVKNWNIPNTASENETSVSTTTESKSSLNTEVPLTSKLKFITKKGGKIAKITTEQVKRNPKVVNNRILTSKNSYWGEDFNRYKRFHALKLTTNKKRANHETKYYDRFKKKMKDKLFEKKATEQKVIDRLYTKDITVDPRIREVEITIINLDELDKMSTSKHFDSFDLPKKYDLRPFKDYSDDLNAATLKSKMKTITEKRNIKMQKITKEKVDYLHNELLYKDIFNEQTSSAPTKESLNTDLTKITEYDAPLHVEYGQTVASNNTWMYPLEKAPIWPNIFNKMQRGKNFHKPKRVHILSHHYKYDIIYDDVKKIGKKRAEGLRPELAPATSTAMNLFRKRTPTIWGTDALHKKRKYFNFRGCKSKSTSGLTESTQHLSTRGNSSDVSMQKLKEDVTASGKNTGKITLARSIEPLTYIEDLEPVPTSIPGNFSDVTMTKLKEDVTASMNNTGKISLARSIEPLTYIKDLEPVPTSTPGNCSDVSMPKLEEDVTASVENTGTISLARSVEPSTDRHPTDIEDLVSMLDMQDLGDINSDIDTEVTLAAMRTEFVTGITVRDSVRGALVKTIAATTPVTTATLVTTSTPVTTAATATTTTASPTVPSSPLSGSVTYNLTQLKKTTSSRKSSKDKGKQLGSGRHRERRLKFSELQHRLKGFMKNFTMTIKFVNVTTTPMKKTKRMCMKYVPEKGIASEKMNEKATETETAEEISGEKEGFALTHCSGLETCLSPVITTPVVESSVTSPRLVDDPGALHYEEVPSYTLDGTQYNPLTTLLPAHQRQCTQDVQGCAYGKQFPTDPEEPMYMEPKHYADQYYQEKTVMSIPTIPPPCEETDPVPHSDLKREVQRNTFTAKDVAALEVIVDLMRNTLNYEDSSKASNFYHGNNQYFTTTGVTNYNSNNSNSTNAIQVHIAIPFEFENGKKRSLSSVPDPVRVRKVFCAKMSTPVDLEYQVNSIEGTITPTSTLPSANTCRSCSIIGARSSSSLIGVCDSCSTTDVDNLTPGMYLLVDKPKHGFALKPLLGKFHISYVKTRQVSSETTTSMMEAKPTDSGHETTSLKSLAKVTLSKDFVSLINEHLLQLNGNRSIVSKDIDSDNARFARSVWFRKLQEKKMRRKKGAQIFIVKRRIDWDKVKAYFGHDRVCNCKCKSNTAMCRACAASDAVIDELIFEFDNIGRYMADHCTEIQTFFWMNPTGGQKLKDSVSKIDKSLADYCKRVKGKCQGRLCKTFSTYIDKRNFIKMAKIKKVEDISCLLNDLDTLSHDLNMTVALNACYNDKLRGNGEKFISQINKCINNKSLSKRSYPTTSQIPMVKQVYSLDNINVNIICNPETPSTPDELMMAATIASQTSSTQFDEAMNNHLLNIDLEDNKYKKRKGFIYFFPRKKKKSKLLSYFDINKKVKRQVDNQASMPLISDGGGAFWYDYLKAGTNEPRLARNGSLHQKLEKLDSINDAPTILDDAVQRAVTVGHVLKVTATAEHNNLGINTIYETVHTRPERNPRETETTTDSLSQNIKQMLQLFGSLEEVESMNDNTTANPTTNFLTDTSILRKVSQDKENKISFVHKVKQKVDEALAKNRKKSLTTSKTKNQKMKPALVKETTSHVSAKEHTIKAVNKHAKTTNAVSDGSTNNRSTTVRLDAKSTASNNTPLSSTVVIKGIAPGADTKSISTPVVNKTTMKSGFKNMIKAATKMFTKEQPQTKHTSEKTSRRPELTPIQTDLIDVVTSSIDNDYDVNEITQNTSENPTILIINDHDSEVSSGSLSDDKKENYKNLLLSIIQFETNNLNDEWSQIAYGGDHKDETDLKRNAPRTPKVESKSSIILKPTSMPEAASSEGNTHLLLKTHNATKTPESLLNKIAEKIGIKIVNPKKVAKKASIRESRRNNKRANCIRNRKLRMGTYQQTPAPVINKEACHTRRTTQPAQICDIQATFRHIQNLQSSVPPKTFENLMKNVSCYKYRNADASFIIPYKKRGKTWDWIRNKRSLKHFHNKIKDDHDFDDETYVVGFEDDSTNIFERFVKGDNGIYQVVQRIKRKVNLETLERSLRNIPTLKPTEDELYVMVGDSVILDCGINAPFRTCDGKFHWKTDRKGMMEQDNVEVDGLTVAIHKVEPRNSGTYTCSLDHTVRKNVKLNVMTVPSFDVVFLPVYKTEENCSYDDLMAVQQLGSLMSNETHCGNVCSVRIDEPVCQKDRSTNTTMLRATAVISMTARPVNCSLQCKRNIVSSLAMLSAANAAVLSSICVEVSREGVCETLTPWKTCVRPVVTHTLRKKDTNGHKEYHQLSSRMSPGKVDVVVICPAGYYLVNKYKLCSSCPPNTSSRAGDNTCRPCPRGTHAEPGAATCHVVKTLHHRRYDWWWYPPCGYVVACCGVLFGCTACVLLSVIVHVVSRDAELPEQDGDGAEQKIHKPMPSVTVAYAHFPGARPLSPSRVILPRFFRPSLTSSRATDSQETKFELWKERNRPPPLPPIDFDP